MKILPNVTYCTLTRQSSGNWGRHVKQHAFLYQLWTTEVLLNILLGPPNHNSQNSPDETHDLGSWAKTKMLYHELELWALMRLYRHEFWTMGFSVILWTWTLLDFKRDFPKNHDSVDLARVANEIKPCGMKILSSTPAIRHNWTTCFFPFNPIFFKHLLCKIYPFLQACLPNLMIGRRLEANSKS